MNTLAEVRDRLSFWTIFQNPIDFPRKFVVRRFVMVAGGDDGQAWGAMPTPDHSVHESLDEARDTILKAHPGLVCICRNQEDEPQVVESWV